MTRKIVPIFSVLRHSMPMVITGNKEPESSRVKVTTGPATEMIGPQFDMNGNPIFVNPLKNRQKVNGTGISVSVSW